VLLLQVENCFDIVLRDLALVVSSNAAKAVLRFLA
jgi:hypothetical protein